MNHTIDIVHLYTGEPEPPCFRAAVDRWLAENSAHTAGRPGLNVFFEWPMAYVKQGLDGFTFNEEEAGVFTEAQADNMFLYGAPGSATYDLTGRAPGGKPAGLPLPPEPDRAPVPPLDGNVALEARWPHAPASPEVKLHMVRLAHAAGAVADEELLVLEDRIRRGDY